MIKKITVSLLILFSSLVLAFRIHSFEIKKKSYDVVKQEVKTNLISMFNVRTNILLSDIDKMSLYDSVASICAKYYYLNMNTPSIFIDPQIITIKNGKISLTKVREMRIEWPHPEKKGELLVLGADVASDLRPGKKIPGKIFNGFYFFGGINTIGGEELKNISSIGGIISFLNIINLSLDLSIHYNGYLSVGGGIGYNFNKTIGMSGGVTFGTMPMGFYLGIKAKLF